MFIAYSANPFLPITVENLLFKGHWNTGISIVCDRHVLTLKIWNVTWKVGEGSVQSYFGEKLHYASSSIEWSSILPGKGLIWPVELKHITQ